jgi:hypothetical protein
MIVVAILITSVLMMVVLTMFDQLETISKCPRVWGAIVGRRHQQLVEIAM